MSVRVWIPVLATAWLCAAPVASAQQEVAREAALGSGVDSLLAAGDSAAALAILRTHLARHPRDAAAWFRQGEVALFLARPRGTGSGWSTQTIRHMRLADSSLKIATSLAPDSGRYHLTRALYFLAGESPLVREGARGAFRQGLGAAERAGDSAMVAATAIELGLWFWRTYDGLSQRRRMPFDLPLGQVLAEAESPRDFDHLAEAYFPRSAAKAGELDYLRSSELFLIALRAEPANSRAWLYSYLSLLAYDAWEELESAARVRLRGAPDDPWAWMTIGLAMHRLDKEADAGRAFDSALSRFDDRERARLTRLARLLRPSDSLRLAAMSPDDRRRTELTYWRFADPLTLTPQNEYWLEFLSRVAYSELMFTVEEFRQRGADSPRGEVYIRYGPPRDAIGSGPDMRGYYGIWWRYGDGLEFFFRLYGPTRVVDEDAFAPQRRRFHDRASSFTNVPVTGSLLPVPVASTRFRGPADSTDVVVVAGFPIAALTSGIDLANAGVRVAFTAFGGGADSMVHDTSSFAVALGSERAHLWQHRAWHHRFAGVESGYRVEALQIESGRGARAVGVVARDTSAGFGTSEILIAHGVRPTSGAEPTRWSDLEFTATVGEVPSSRDLGLIWETYALRPDSTRSNAYRVDIGLVRTDGTRIGRAVARVLGGTLGRGEGRGRDDRVTVSFERRSPSRPVSLDYLTLDLGGLAPGPYSLTITVTDVVANLTAVSKRQLTIVQ